MSDFIWSQATPKSGRHANASYYQINFLLALANWELYQKEERSALPQKRNKKTPIVRGFRSA
jgi:hypothetical protein